MYKLEYGHMCRYICRPTFSYRTLIENYTKMNLQSNRQGDNDKSKYNSGNLAQSMFYETSSLSPAMMPSFPTSKLMLQVQPPRSCTSPLIIPNIESIREICSQLIAPVFLSVFSECVFWASVQARCWIECPKCLAQICGCKICVGVFCRFLLRIVCFCIACSQSSR